MDPEFSWDLAPDPVPGMAWSEPGLRRPAILASMNHIQGRPDGTGRKVGIVYARWNELAVRPLLEGALDELRRHGDPEVVVVEVPGSWEAPPAATALVEAGVDAVIALGCILQGATPHAAQLAANVSNSLMALQNATGVPVSWGILTPETQEQALERAGMKVGNKGREAALAALEMVEVLARARMGFGEPSEE